MKVKCIKKQTTQAEIAKAIEITPSYVNRLIRKNDVDLLKDFLYEAIFIPKGMKLPERDIIEKPELRVYTDDFGTRVSAHS